MKPKEGRWAKAEMKPVRFKRDLEYEKPIRKNRAFHWNKTKTSEASQFHEETLGSTKRVKCRKENQRNKANHVH